MSCNLVGDGGGPFGMDSNGRVSELAKLYRFIHGEREVEPMAFKQLDKFLNYK